MKISLLNFEQLNEFIRKCNNTNDIPHIADETVAYGVYSLFGELMSVVVFSSDGCEKTSCNLIGFYTHEKFRELEIESELFDEACKELKKKNYFYINYYSTSASLGIDSNVFDSLTFDFVTTKEIFVYDRGALQRDIADKVYNAIDKTEIKICQFDDYEDERLKKYWEQVKGTECYISKEQYDPNICVFASLNERIVSAACAVRLPKGVILAKKVYFDDKVKKVSTLFPFMMSKVVCENKDGHIEFLKLYINLKRAEFEKGLFELIGKPEFEDELVVHSRLLD